MHIDRNGLAYAVHGRVFGTLLLLTSITAFTWPVAGQQSGSAAGNAGAPKLQTHNVIVNRVRLSEETVAGLIQKYGIPIQDGAYWYDNRSGAWGMEGGPTAGIGVAGLYLGGPLRADASGGQTRVFINGRELHELDVIGLSRLGAVLPGRYWVDERGNCGLEGGPAFVNLARLAGAGSKTNCGPSVYAKDRTWAGCDGDGGMFVSFKNAAGRGYEWSK